jgi:hypothetical protein
MAEPDLAQAVDKAVFPGMQGGPLMHTIAAKAVIREHKFVILVRAAQGVQQGALASTRAANDDDEFTLTDFQTDFTHGSDDLLCQIEFFGNPIKPDHLILSRLSLAPCGRP